MTAYELAVLSDEVYGSKKTVVIDLPMTTTDASCPAPPAGKLPFSPLGTIPVLSPLSITQAIAKVVLPSPKSTTTVQRVTWTRRDAWENELGFFAAVYEKGDEQALVYRGSADRYDFLIDDLGIFFGMTPLQAIPALLLTDMAGLKSNAYLAGHSLGGALAVIAASQTGKACVTFNAPGVTTGCMALSPAAKVNGYTAVLDALARCIRNSRHMRVCVGNDAVGNYMTSFLQAGKSHTLPMVLNVLAAHSMKTVLSQMKKQGTYYVQVDL